MKNTPKDIIGLSMELSRFISRAMGKSNASVKGMNPLRIHGLSFLKDHPGMTLTDFAKMMNITISTASTFIDRLVEEKLVTRIQDKKNRRKVLLRLTPAGQKALNSCVKQKQKVLSTVFSVLSHSDRTQFARILQKLLASQHSS